MVIDKKIKMNLVGIDGNAFAIIGNFRKQARKEKWTKEEIDSVIEKAMEFDYNHLLVTILNHTK